MYDKYESDVQTMIAFCLAKWYFRGHIEQNDYKKLIDIYLIEGNEIYLGDIDDYEFNETIIF